MDIQRYIQRYSKSFTSEHGLLLMFLVVSTYMFIRATAWGHNSRIFPQIMSGGVIVGALLLLFQDYLPGPIQQFVSGDASAFARTESELDEQVEEIEEPEPVQSEYDRPVDPVVFTGILIAIYAVTGYLFSLLVMSPLFAAAYLIWFKKPWYLVILLSVIALAIAWAFSSLIIVPVDRGILVGDLL